MKKGKYLLLAIMAMSLLFASCKKKETVLPVKVKSKTKTITNVTLNISSKKVTATVDVVKKTITATVPFGTDLTKISLAITHTGASISPDPKTAQDFSGGKKVNYIVKAEDGTTQMYIVSIDLETILQSASISAFMGDNASDITISLKPAGDYKLYISNDENCDISNYKNCANAEMIEINGASKTFNSKTLTLSKEATTYFKLQDSKDSYNIIKKANVFSARSDHQVVVFKDKMYLIAGYDQDFKNDVYSSSDGIAWTKIKTSGTIFSARSDHQVVVFKDKMYVIGGNDGALKNDVYSSSNGIAWTKIKTSGNIFFGTNFSARSNHQAVVFKDKMYLIAGGDKSFTLKNDVYSSSDGEIWNKITTSGTIFSARSYHQVVVFKDKMYLIAGGDDNSFTVKNDVWQSSDGITWNKITTSGTIFSARSYHQVVVFKDKMYLIAGLDKARKNDVYSSNDGKAWNKETEHAAFSARSNHQVVVFKDKMYLIAGGDDNSFTVKNDVWQSSDGITWEKAFGLSFSK